MKSIQNISKETFQQTIFLSNLSKKYGIKQTNEVNWKSQHRGSWKTDLNKKIFLEELKRKFNIQNPSDWGKLSTRDVRREGGGSLLNFYKGSLFRCLQSVFPEIKWKIDWFQRIPSRNWENFEDRKKFLDEMQNRFNIKTPSDWGKVTTREINKQGGVTLLTYYKGSLFRCLKSIYPNVEWKREWFPSLPNRSWRSFSERRKFLDEIKEKFNIKTPNEWGYVTTDDIQKAGGSGILKYYKGSLFRCLQSIYREIDWKREWFPSLPLRSWENMSEKKKFLEQIKISFQIKTPRDWGKVTIANIHAAGGGALLKYYDGSLFKCLNAVYSEIEWKKDWFPRIPMFSKSHWNSVDNCKVFLEQIVVHYNVQSETDWRRITVSLIKNKGGKGLLSKYGNSIQNVMKSLFPTTDFSQVVSDPQQKLQARLGKK